MAGDEPSLAGGILSSLLGPTGKPLSGGGPSGGQFSAKAKLEVDSADIVTAKKRIDDLTKSILKLAEAYAKVPGAAGAGPLSTGGTPNGGANSMNAGYQRAVANGGVILNPQGNPSLPPPPLGAGGVASGNGGGTPNGGQRSGLGRFGKVAGGALLAGAYAAGGFWEKRLPTNIGVDTVGQSLAYQFGGSALSGSNRVINTMPWAQSREDAMGAAAILGPMAGQNVGGFNTNLMSASGMGVIMPGMSAEQGAGLVRGMQDVRSARMGALMPGGRIAVRNRPTTDVFMDVKRRLSKMGIPVQSIVRDGVQPGGATDRLLDEFFGSQEEKDSFLSWLQMQTRFESNPAYKGQTFNPAAHSGDKNYLSAGGYDTNSVFAKNLETSAAKTKREQVTFSTRYGDVVMEIAIHDKTNEITNSLMQNIPGAAQFGGASSWFGGGMGMLNSAALFDLASRSGGRGGVLARLFGGGATAAAEGGGAAAGSGVFGKLGTAAAAGGVGGFGVTAAAATAVLVTQVASILGMSKLFESVKDNKLATGGLMAGAGATGSLTGVGAAAPMAKVLSESKADPGSSPWAATASALRQIPGVGGGWSWFFDTFGGGGQPAGDPRSDQLTGINPSLRPKLEAMLAANPKLYVNSGHRTFSRQSNLNSQGYPVATGGSLHTQGLAADIGPTSQLGWLAANAKKFGLWFPDNGEPWHVESTDTQHRRGYSMGGALNWAKGTGGPGAGLLPDIIARALFGGGGGGGGDSSPGGGTGGSSSGWNGDVNDPQIADKLLYAIRTTESGGNYTAKNPGSSASGAYQFMDETWAKYGGFAHAYQAPKAIQDAKAREMAMGYWNQYHDPRMVAKSWFYPAKAYDDNFQPPGPNGGITLGQYADKWMQNFGPIGDPGMRGGRGINVRGGNTVVHLNMPLQVTGVSQADAEHLVQMIEKKLEESNIHKKISQGAWG